MVVKITDLTTDAEVQECFIGLDDNLSSITRTHPLRIDLTFEQSNRQYLQIEVNSPASQQVVFVSLMIGKLGHHEEDVLYNLLP